MMNLTFDDINSFRTYINNNGKDFLLDLSDKNMFDCLKFVVLSSAYFFQKFPNDRVKCIVDSDDVKSLISSFDIKNFEFV